MNDDEQDALSKYGDDEKRSFASRKADEELIESLDKMSEGNELQFYQSEVRRFETLTMPNNSGQTNSDDKPRDAAATNQLLMQQGSGAQRRKSFKGSSKRYLQTVNMSKAVSKAERLIRKRKFCRYLTLIGFLLALLFIVIFLYMDGLRVDRHSVNFANKDIKISLQNCRLFLMPCTNCPSRNIDLDYRSSITTIFSTGISDQNIKLDYQDSSIMYQVTHFDDIKGCNLYMHLPADTRLKSLSIHCEKNCVVIQRSGALNTEKLTIKANTASVNLAKLLCGDLDIDINTGFFQLNNIELESGSGHKREITVGNGDVIIETTTSISLSFISASENYCFSSMSNSIVQAVTKTTIGSELTDFLTQTHMQKGMFANQWKGQYNLCNSNGCGTSPAQINITNFEGNIYINVLDNMPMVVKDSATIIKGSRYGSKIDIPDSAQDIISQKIEITRQASLPNLILKFKFGNTDGLSANGLHWVYTDHFLYSIVKPWWMSFFSLGKLVENTNDISTFFSPGFCPYRHVVSVRENIEVDKSLSNYLNVTDGVLSFLKPANQALIPYEYLTSDGFAEFAEFAQFSDEWVQVKTVSGQNFQYEPILLTENIDIFLLIVLSIVVTFLLAARMTIKLVGLLFASFQVVRERLYHIEFYWKIYTKVANSNSKNSITYDIDDEDKDKLQSSSLKNVNIKLAKSYFDLPSTMAFVDYMIVELLTSRMASLTRFYKIAFEEANYDKIVDFEMQNLQSDRVPLKQLKSLYQQMCFLLSYKEEDLSGSSSISLLNDRGMVLTNTDSHRQYLIRLTINTNSDMSLSYLKNDKKQNSLQIFLDKYCQQTNFDEDKIPFDVFTEQYSRFCKLNHMEAVLIDHILLKNEFGIESRTYLKEMVERERDFDMQHQKEDQTKKGFFSKLVTRFLSMFRGSGFYNLKVSRIKNVNLFLAGKLNESDVGAEEYKHIINLAILEDNWWTNDVQAVLLELLIDLILSIPFFSIFIFQEIEHSSYSLRDESINIYGFNLNSNDIWLLPAKVYRFLTSGIKEHASFSNGHTFYILLGI